MAPAILDERREALRSELLARIPRWYSPWVHLAFPSLVGLGIVAACLALVHRPAAWELALIPVSLVLLNASEWRIHRDILHRRTRPLELLYDRHTPEHHMVFVTEDMAIRSTREFRLVLIPSFGIVAAAVGVIPVPLLFWALGRPNVGLLFLATAMLYIVGYEWLHLAYHAPAESLVGRSRLIARLRRHHALHHDPTLMQRWNFNVTVPLWDWVRGTIWRAPE